VLSVIEAAIADEPDFEGMLALGKYRVLVGKDGDPEKAQEYGKRLVDKIFKDNAAALNQLAWLTVGSDDNGNPNAKLVKLALAAALRADELSKGQDANIADTLARAYFVSGDAAKALEDYKKAVEKAAGEGK
jgi:tetratricopeptide (TPR) repeat protein